MGTVAIGDPRRTGWWLLLAAALPLSAAEYAAPAGIRPALRRPGAASILPGGRIIAPLGRQYITGPGPFGLAVSADGRTVVTANSGPLRASVTVLTAKNGTWETNQLVAPEIRPGERDSEEWHGVSVGIALAGGHTAYVAEGNSGRVRLLDLNTGSARHVYDLNQEGYSDSYTGDLALDEPRGLLYVLDEANFRMAILDLHRHRLLASVRVGRLPFALALSPDGRRAYVTNLGMFQYQPIPGADPRRARETGLPFPAFGFPSAEAVRGAERATGSGTVMVPGLGDPNAAEGNSLCIVDVSDPGTPKVTGFVRTGVPFGNGIHGGSSPSAVLATTDRVFVSNAHNDTITVLDAHRDTVLRQIPIRIPGLDSLRGVLPVGLSLQGGRVLVAEAGINAVGVVDPSRGEVLGHLPAAWFPTRVATRGDTVFVISARGQGAGPSAVRFGPASEDSAFPGTWRRGAVSIFRMPPDTELTGQSAAVLAQNGFQPAPEAAPALPAGIRHVVLIVKESRAFDEVFGDIVKVSNGPVLAAPALARFGREGYVSGDRRRLSLQRVNVTPNQHAIALRWCFSDNFYADSDSSVGGHHWLAGAYPDAWTESTLLAGNQKDFRFPTTAPGRLSFPESDAAVQPHQQPEAGTVWDHLERHGVSFLNFGEGLEVAGADQGPGLQPTGARALTNTPIPAALDRNSSREYPAFNMDIPDQYRASQLIEEVTRRYIKGGQPFPRFVLIHLPNDGMATPRPADGYPYEASFVADNDLALGRIVAFLSKTRWWPRMAIFITESGAQGGWDHVDAHRTLLIGAGPYFKPNYVSHVNSSFPGLLKTVFRLLGVPPLNLFDASASDLTDCFRATPDPSAFQPVPEDPRLFEPSRARLPGEQPRPDGRGPG